MATWHLITGEYPPQVGGVSDYTRVIAGALAAAGDAVHVWCPPAEGETPRVPGVSVHRELGRMAPRDLKRVGRMLDRMPGPRKLLVQWVPHSYGYRSLNVAFCAWLWSRSALRGDRVQVMVHEPWLAFSRRSVRQSVAASVHRLMTLVLLRAAERVWLSAPWWERLWRPYALGRRTPFEWLPLPNGVPVHSVRATGRTEEARFVAPGGVQLGHFGTYGAWMAERLTRLLPALLHTGGRAMLLIGKGSEAFLEGFLGGHPELAGRIRATGVLTHAEVSRHLAACDLMVQPYPDGVSARRTSLLAVIAHGVPAVTTQAWATEPLWPESGAVALAPLDDLDAERAAVERLIADPEERRRLGEAGRRLYETRFDLARTIERLRAS